MKKRLFQILDEMNVFDIENGTRTLSIGNSFVGAEKVKAGTKVTMGADDSAIMQIHNNKVIPILLLIDQEKYNELKDKL